MGLVTLADQSVDPHVTRVANLAPITSSCFEQFSRWGPDGSLAPALASSWEETPDRLTLTFHLRPDATFWDGSPVTAEDARWSFERYTSLSGGDTFQSTLRSLVESVDAPDARTVVVNMRQPSTLRLSFGIIWPQGWNIASQRHYEAVGEDEFRHRPMCTGPFEVVRNEVQAFTTLRAHRGHYERRPHVDRIRMDIIPEITTRLARLRNDEAHFIDGISGPAREELAGDEDIVLFESEASALTTLYFQEPEAYPYNDIRLRRALRLAVNQEGLIDTVLQGAGTKAPGAHIFPVTSGYEPSLFPAQEYDPARAKALIEEAGLREAPVKAWAYDSSSAPGIPLMMEAVIDMWRQAGVDAGMEMLEAGAYFDRYQSHSLGGITALASGAWFDGEALLRTDYLKGQPFSPPTTDEISAKIESLGTIFDEDERLAAIQDTYAEIIEGVWSITLPWANTTWASRRDRIAYWNPHPAWAYPHAFETMRAAGGA